ncbi:MAG: electron transfer flavoprotein subunit beta [Xanthobacteraceae bacterium]|jgi:electron transfer flavoprotein beta subunit|nr:electron transfer flavoprotein subunit beta [Xanthobacteraceae bacterium]
MRISVLLSGGRHPVSGRACPVPVELQAIRLARSLPADIAGLHAGPDASAVHDALGHGLPRISHIVLPEGSDPLDSLAAVLGADTPDLILAGRSGQGGEDSGLLPYVLASRLGNPIVADAVALHEGGDGTLIVEQALPKGARRRVTVRLPAFVTVHPAAPAPLPFAYGAARRGTVETRAGIAAPLAARAIEERAYRKRPKLIAKAAASASAADRLRAATEAASGGGRLLVEPTPDEAAREIIAFLREIGVLRRSDTTSS